MSAVRDFDDNFAPNLPRPVNELNNKYLYAAEDFTDAGATSTLGVFKNHSDSTAGSSCLLFQKGGSGTFNVQTFKNGVVALAGRNDGILNLVLANQPSASKIPQGTVMEWGTFALNGQNEVSVSDGGSAARRWVAYDLENGNYGVGLYDGRLSLLQSFRGADGIAVGVTLVPRDLYNISVVAVESNYRSCEK